MNRILLTLTFGFALLSGAAFGANQPDPNDIRIGTRPVKPDEIGKPEIAATLKKLSKNLPGAPKPGEAVKPETGWEKSADAVALAEEAKNRPEVYIRIIIPPGQPNFVSEATPPQRARAACVLGMSGDRRAMVPLLMSSCYDSDEIVRLTAGKALPLLEEPVAMRKLVDVAISRDFTHIPWPIRKNACAALRHYGDKEAVERIVTEVAFELAGGNPLDVHNRLRGVPKGGLGTDNPIGMPDSTPDLKLSEQDMYPALSALKEITGQTFAKSEKDVKTWTEWWDKSKEKFAFKED
jgi:hypothetical protein